MKTEQNKQLGISKELDQHIENLLRYDEGFDDGEGVKSEDYLETVGIIDKDGQFCNPESVDGEFRIALQWLKDNI